MSMISIDDMLSKNECNDLIEYINGIMADLTSEDSAPGGYQRVRAFDDRLSAKVRERLKTKITGFGEVRGDIWKDDDAIWIHPQWYFTRYDVGTYIDTHKDGRTQCDGSESFASILIYLSDVEGGDTQAKDISIRPSTGRAVFIDQETSHWSSPVTSGVKYMVRSNIMFRDQPECE